MLKVESTSNVQKGIFKNLNLTLEDNGLVFICGRKESNSKEFQKLIAGVTYNPDIKVTLDGVTINSEQELESYRLNNVGFVFGNSQFIKNDTVRYNTIISTVSFSDEITEEKIYEVLNFTGLIDKENTNVEELTEFEKHKLDIARALVKSPKMIYANNPVARLNEEEADQIWTMLKEISKNCLVIVGNAVINVAEKYADKIIAFNDHGINGEETIEIRDVNLIVPNGTHYNTTKNSTLSFKKSFLIALRLLKNKILIMVLFTLTLSVFLYGSAIKNDSYLKFAKALDKSGVTKVYVERQNDGNNRDASISGEYREEIEGIASDIKVQWSNYLSKDPQSGYAAHLKFLNTTYKYPDSLFMLNDAEYKDIDLLCGSYGQESAINETNGVYISKSEAEGYIKYYNACIEKMTAYSIKAFWTLYGKLYPEYVENDKTTAKEITTINELLGEYIIFAFGSSFTNFKVAGIYEDNKFDGQIFLTTKYQFEEGYDKDKFYSLGVVTLSKDVNNNAKLIEKYASVVRNERERIIITTTLDDTYNELYASINKIPGTANLASLILLVLTICGSAIMSFLLVSTYRDEIVLSRTYGFDRKESYKVSLITNALVSVISTVASIIIVLIASLISNIVIKNNYSFINFNYVVIPLYGYLVALLAIIVLTLVFTAISIRTLKKKDYIVY